MSLRPAIVDRRKAIRALIAIGFALTGAFHLFLVFLGESIARYIVDGEHSPERHLLFAGINLVMAVLVALSPSLARFAVWPLLVQQTWSHGGDFLRSLQTERVDLLSLLVVVFMWSSTWFLWAFWPTVEEHLETQKRRSPT